MIREIPLQLHMYGSSESVIHFICFMLDSHNMGGGQTRARTVDYRVLRPREKVDDGGKECICYRRSLGLAQHIDCAAYRAPRVSISWMALLVGEENPDL